MFTRSFFLTLNYIRSMQNENIYEIPLKYRKLENLHIVFWLLKDVAWCMIWKPLGIFMIFPTLFISILIAKRTWNFVSERFHNLAITCWISANSYWMISEFAEFDSMAVWGVITYKHFALIPFLLGMLLLLYYYMWWKPRHEDQLETM